MSRKLMAALAKKDEVGAPERRRWTGADGLEAEKHVKARGGRAGGGVRKTLRKVASI